MTRLEPCPGVTHGHARLMAVVMQQRPGVQIQSVAFTQRGQTASRMGMQRAQVLTILLSKHGKEPAQSRLAGDAFDAHRLGHGGIILGR